MDFNEKYELIKFKDGEFELDVNVSPTEDTVWLTIEQMCLLFERERTVIQRHVNNVFADGEVEKIIVCKKCTVLVLANRRYFIIWM